MADSDPYFQFPLCALAFRSNESARFDHIISYCVVSVGKDRWAKLDSEHRSFYIKKFKADETKPYDYRANREDHNALMFGATHTNVVMGSIWTIQLEHDTFSDWARRFQIPHGRDAEVRIRSNILWDAKKGHLKYRLFAVLCAVYSVIGNNKGPVRVTREMIRPRALGYKSKKVFDIAFPEREDGAQPLTERQLRDALDDLEQRGFFARVNPSPRKAFFSHRMSREELITAVAVMEARDSKFAATKRKANEQLRESIEHQKRAYYSGPPIIVDPPEVQGGSEEGPKEVHNGVHNEVHK